MTVLPFPQIAVLIVGMIASSLSSGGVQSLSTALAGDLSHAHAHGKNIAILQIACDLESTIGPIIAYAMLPITSLNVVYWGCTMLMLINAVWIIQFKQLIKWR